jgi:hypothetical protein
MTPLEKITFRVNRNGDVNAASTPRPLLTLPEFFEGNDIVGSICANVIPTPTPAEVYTTLQRVAARADVADVLVQVTQFDAPEWPFSDTVWVVTSAGASEVLQWFEERIRPDDCCSGWLPGVAYEPCRIPTGMQPIGCWWD